MVGWPNTAATWEGVWTRGPRGELQTTRSLSLNPKSAAHQLSGECPNLPESQFTHLPNGGEHWTY